MSIGCPRQRRCVAPPFFVFSFFFSCPCYYLDFDVVRGGLRNPMEYLSPGATSFLGAPRQRNLTGMSFPWAIWLARLASSKNMLRATHSSARELAAQLPSKPDSQRLSCVPIRVVSHLDPADLLPWGPREVISFSGSVALLPFFLFPPAYEHTYSSIRPHGKFAPIGPARFIAESAG